MSKGLLSRRTVLKGLGVSLALPWLEAMEPVRGLGAEAAASPRRLAFVFFPNGAIMQKWTPKTEGTGYEMSPTLKPLAKVRKKINILTGLMHENANAKGDGDGDHARSAATFLTSAHARKEGLHAGVSVDQIAAARIGQTTKLPSLELGIEPNRKTGECDAGYACAYSSNISWKNASSPMAKEINPKLAFERLFGTGDLKDRSAAAKREFYRKSILDSAAGEAGKLQKKVGQSDRRRLDEFFNNVREMERRIARAQSPTGDSPRPDAQLPAGIPTDGDEHLRLMYDLLVMVFQTDSTRIATFMLANEGSDRLYEKTGNKEGHHILSHHKNEPDTMSHVQRIDQYLVSRFAAFVEKLDRTREGDGSLLDHSMIVYGCAIGDGHAHDHNSLPVVLAGGGGCQITTGRHLKYPDRTPI